MFSSMAVIGVQSIVEIAFAAEGGEAVIRRVEIWGLFYRMMVAAFIVGAVVQGLNVYISWRFRESHPRFKNINNNPGGQV